MTQSCNVLKGGIFTEAAFSVKTRKASVFQTNIAFRLSDIYSEITLVRMGIT